jgi:hypothetical protein
MSHRRPAIPELWGLKAAIPAEWLVFPACLMVLYGEFQPPFCG